MKYKRNRLQFSTTVSKPAVDIIEQVAKEIDGSSGRAVDVIVYEWKENKEMKPLIAKKEVDLERLQSTLEDINKRLRTIEKLMAWQVRKMTDE